jgi:Domain of unknown function (DUF4932)
MKRFICLTILTLLSVPIFAQKIKEKFIVTYNKNIETYWFAQMLAAEVRPSRVSKKYYGYPNFAKELKEKHSAFQPVAFEAIKEYYDKLKTHKIAKLTAEVNDKLLDEDIGDDVMMTPLLTQKEFPTNDYKTNFVYKNDNLSKEKVTLINSLIKNYIKELGEFYKSENIGNLFEKYKKFYRGAIAEINKNVPSKSFEAIEQFYGEQNLSYTVFVSPMFVWMIDNNQGRGIGGFVTTPKEKKPFEIISPYVKIPANRKINDYKEFGFNHKLQAQALTIHEFSHSFVNKEIEKHNDRIQLTDSLFTKSKLSSPEIMPTQGVQNWNTFIIESIVRLGEIRVALMQKDTERANYLREDYILKKKFVLIPLIEEKIKLYESNRTKYPKFADFLPELLTVFENMTVDKINNMVNK